jgi:hypothetical protein
MFDKNGQKISFIFEDGGFRKKAQRKTQRWSCLHFRKIIRGGSAVNLGFSTPTDADLGF